MKIFDHLNRRISTALIFATFAILVFSVGSLYADELEDEVKELNAVYEKMTREYWDLKQKNLREREKIKDKIDNLDSILKSRYERKNSLTEELFLVKENLGKAEEKLEESIQARNAFKALLFNIVTSESESVSTFYPKMIEPATLNLNQIKNDLENAPFDAVEGAVDFLIDYKRGLIAQGEVSEIYRTKILNPATESAEDVDVFRWGFVHSSFVGDSFSGILLREGGLSGIGYKWVEDLPSDSRSKVEAGVAEAFNYAGSREGLIDVPVDVNQVGRQLRSLAEEESGVLQSAIDFFSAGGIVMYPLLLVCLLGLYIVYERLAYFWQFRSKTLFLEEVKSCLYKSDVEGAKKILKRKQNSFVAMIFLPFLESRLEDKKQAEMYLQDQFGIRLPEVEKGLSVLAVLAAVAPLLGLLGTVTGMIELFDVITLYGTGNPKILASGISVALITTQTGLTIAVPLILIHHYLVRRKTQVVELLDVFATEVVQILYNKKLPQEKQGRQ